jgi:hypothetical protein
MRKMHIKVVLDVFVVSDDSVKNPGSAVSDAILDASIYSKEVDIQDVQVEHYEVTDSR